MNSSPLHPTRLVRQPPSTSESARTFLELTRLLNDIEPLHPEISAPLRLTLIRAHRDDQIGWLDAQRFRSVVYDLLHHVQDTPHHEATA